MPKRLQTVRDASTGVAFVRVPGGTVDLGLRDDEIVELRALIGDERELAEARGAMVRPHAATVEPFLVAQAPLSRTLMATVIDDFDVVGDGFARIDAKTALRATKVLGYRLLTEDEWEYVARAGGGSWLADVHGLVASAFGRKAKASAKASAKVSPKEGTTAHKENALGVEGLGWGSWIAGAKSKAPTILRSCGKWPASNRLLQSRS